MPVVQNVLNMITDTQTQLQAVRLLAQSRQEKLSPQAFAEATLKLDGAQKNLDTAKCMLATKPDDELVKSYVNAASAAITYVHTFVQEPAQPTVNALPQTADSRLKEASDTLSVGVQSSTAVVQPADTEASSQLFDPRYNKIHKRIAELDAMLTHSRDVLDADTIAAASTELLAARTTLVSAQAASDANNTKDAGDLFDGAAKHIKTGMGILAAAARQVIKTEGSH